MLKNLVCFPSIIGPCSINTVFIVINIVQREYLLDTYRQKYTIQMTLLCRHLSVTWKQVDEYTQLKPDFISKMSPTSAVYTEKHLDAFYSWYNSRIQDDRKTASNVDNTNKVSLWALPDDLIKLVLMTLSLTTMTEMSRTCTRLQRMGNSDMVWTPLLMRPNDTDWVLGPDDEEEEASNGSDKGETKETKNIRETRQISSQVSRETRQGHNQDSAFHFVLKHAIVRIEQRKRKRLESQDTIAPAALHTKPSKKRRLDDKCPVNCKSNKTIANAKLLFKNNLTRGAAVMGFDKMTRRYEILVGQMSRLLDLAPEVSSMADFLGPVLYFRAIESLDVQMQSWIMKRYDLLGGLMHCLYYELIYKMLPILRGIPVHTETISARKEFQQRIHHLHKQYEKLLQFHMQNMHIYQRIASSSCFQTWQQNGCLISRLDCLFERHKNDQLFKTYLAKVTADFPRLEQIADSLARVVLDLQTMQDLLAEFRTNSVSADTTADTITQTVVTSAIGHIVTSAIRHTPVTTHQIINLFAL